MTNEALASFGNPFAAEGRDCLHCGLPVDASRRDGFCCTGCKAVYGLLHSEHLDRFYDLRRGRGVPVPPANVGRRDTKWLEDLELQVRSGGGPTRLVLDVQGLHCVGCVWLIEELFRRAEGHEQVTVNPALGRVDLVVRSTFDVRAFVVAIERFGYLFGPASKETPAASRDLLWRLGACAAISMNSMIFAIPLYAGLDGGPVYRLFTTLNLALGAGAVVVGGTVFFRSAWRALRHCMLHLDLPIALGIALAFAGSVHSYFFRHSEAAYFDTLDVFITLMLLGRWLQERAVERNRAWLLANDGTAGLLVRRVRSRRVETVPCETLCQGDTVMVAPGELVPVDARLEGEGGSFSLDWIVGESRPRSYAVGDVVPAGAFSCGREARTLRAETAFERSPLRDLLRAPERGSERASATPWFQRLSKAYVLGVLVTAAAGFLAWWAVTRDPTRALGVTTSILVVTCPCAFGIAVPLAYEIVQVRLRRAGLFVRTASFLDRAQSVRRVVFDKTGTLTTGLLALGNPEVLDGLSPPERVALYDLVARSGHPKSIAIRTALEERGVNLDPEARVEETDLGLELVRGGKRWRAGDPRWVGAPASADCAFGVDGAVLATFSMVERLRDDAAHEVRALAEDGCEVWLLSGDTQQRVDAAGGAAGIPLRRAFGDMNPRDKARFLQERDRGDTLFVGDGVNDALAVDEAHTSGTPAVDRPYIPGRADFFFVTPGLAPVRLALRSAHALAQVVRADLAIAVAYNVLAVGFALAGRMSPLLCAVLMPASSLTTIGATVAALSSRRRPWRS